MELAASAGLLLDGWQAEALDVLLGEKADGRWAATETAVVVPRQNGKGSLLEAIELAGLFLFGERLILHSAHEFKTAQEAFLRVLGLIQSTPDLDRLVARVRTSHGEEGVELLSGQRLRFVARSGGSGRGFTGDRLILDEAYNLPGRMLAALLPTLSAKSMTGNPQIVYASSAPLPREESDVLRRVCRRGRSGSDGLAYIEYSADPDSDIDDPDALARANPGLGIRISAAFCLTERGAMSDEDYLRERLGIFPIDDDAQWSVIPKSQWDQVCFQEASPSAPHVFAVDVSEGRDRASIVSVGENRAVELLEHREGLGWLPQRCRELNEKWRPRWAWNPAGPVGSFKADFEAAGMQLVPVDGAEFVKACGALYTDVADRLVEVRWSPVFDAAVAGAVKVARGDAWCWSRSRASVDLSALIALTVGLHVARVKTSSGVIDPNSYEDEEGWDDE